ncbi:hypothetical protein THAOC_36637, partial [Thalassiosira oceanica]
TVYSSCTPVLDTPLHAYPLPHRPRSAGEVAVIRHRAPLTPEIEIARFQSEARHTHPNQTERPPSPGIRRSPRPVRRPSADPALAQPMGFTSSDVAVFLSARRDEASANDTPGSQYDAGSRLSQTAASPSSGSSLEAERPSLAQGKSSTGRTGRVPRQPRDGDGDGPEPPALVALRPPAVCGRLRANNEDALSCALHALPASRGRGMSTRGVPCPVPGGGPLDLRKASSPPLFESPLWGPVESPLLSIRASVTWGADGGEGGNNSNNEEDGRPAIMPDLPLALRIRSAGRSSPSKRLDAEREFQSALLDPLCPSAAFAASARFDRDAACSPLSANVRCALASLLRCGSLDLGTLPGHLANREVVSGLAALSEFAASDMEKRLRRAMAEGEVGEVTGRIVDALSWGADGGQAASPPPLAELDRAIAATLGRAHAFPVPARGGLRPGRRRRGRPASSFRREGRAARPPPVGPLRPRRPAPDPVVGHAPLAPLRRGAPGPVGPAREPPQPRRRPRPGRRGPLLVVVFPRRPGRRPRPPRPARGVRELERAVPRPGAVHPPPEAAGLQHLRGDTGLRRRAARDDDDDDGSSADEFFDTELAFRESVLAHPDADIGAMLSRAVARFLRRVVAAGGTTGNGARLARGARSRRTPVFPHCAAPSLSLCP